LKSPPTSNLTEETSSKSWRDKLDPGRKFVTNNPEHPIYYTKLSIRIFSVLSSPLFGSFLLLSNLQKNKNSYPRILIFLFGLSFTILSIYIVNNMEQPGAFHLVLNSIGGSILSEYFWNKNIGKETYHRKKKIWKPLIIFILISLPFIISQIYVARNGL